MEMLVDTLQPEAPTVFDRLRNVAHSAVDYMTDTLDTFATPARRLAAGLSAASLAIGMTPGLAEAKAPYTIIPGQGMDGLKLGDTSAQVNQIVGSIFSKKNILDGNVSISEAGIVVEMNTNSPRFKTSHGISVGSPLSAVHTAYPTAKRGSSPEGPDYNIAGTYRGKPVVTTFYTEHGSKVAQIEVSDKGDQLPPGVGLPRQ